MTTPQQSSPQENLAVSQQSDPSAKVAFLRKMFVIATLVTFGMGFIRWQESVTLGMVDFGFTLFSILMLYWLHRSAYQIDRITNISLTVFFLLFFAIYLLAPQNITRISVFFLFMASAFFLKGRRSGLFWLITTLVLLNSTQFVPGIDTGFSWVDLLTVNLYLTTQYFIYTHYEQYKEEQRKRLQEQEALRMSEERWRLALEGAGDAIWDWDIAADRLDYSKRFLEMLGHADNAFENRHEKLMEAVHPDDLPELQNAIKHHLDSVHSQFSAEFRILCKNGDYIWVLSRGRVTRRDPAGRATHMAGTHIDITEKKQADELIWTQANFDSLTHLPNRRLFRDRLDQEVKKAQRHGERIALMFIDLDHFKEINDTLGHQMGDELLAEAGRRIRNCVRESDTVARLGGDEFTVILPEFSEMGDIDRIARHLLESISLPFQLGAERVYVGASIGVTIFPDDTSDIENLIKNADQALYAAKSSGRNRFNYFTSTMQEIAQARMRLVNDMRHALANGEFAVYYQPIVDLATGKIHKAEALLRWQHPQHGFISPATFIPVAEDTGVINELGDLVFDRAAMQVKRWQETCSPAFQISINKSPVQFRAEGKGHGHWLEKLEEIGLTGNAIVVEITEGLLLHADEDITATLLKFRDAGIQVAIDDFGTGYSSLAYLKKFDIDFLKIDQSFVHNLTPDSPDFALCEAIVVMAHKLELKVIAEGVETELQRDILQGIGCDYAQGYLYSKPVTAEEFERLL